MKLLLSPFLIENSMIMTIIRHALKSKENFATERFYDDYRKMFKSESLLCFLTKNL